MSRAHQTLVTDQFGPQAVAYVASAVHAEGEDLRHIETAARDRAGGRVLDLGCGGGHVAYRVAPHAAEVTAYDLSADMLDAVARTAAERGLANIVTKQGAAEHLPFADASFDLVVSRYSAHHWHDVEAGLREARRVLKPGGYAVFADVATPGRPLLDTFLQTIELLRDPSHVRNYTAAEWVAALARSGFRPGPMVPRRLRLEFTSWVGRMRTPEAHVTAIRSLEEKASREVREHFAVEDDGSFTLDTLTVEAAPA